MFARNPDPRVQPQEPMPPQPPPEQPRRTSTPRPTSIFEGHVRGKGEVQIAGSFTGDIEVRRLLVAPSARIEGSIRCEQVEIRGRVKGNIEAQTVKIYETAHVEGDVLHRHLSIDSGAQFEGRSLRLASESQAEAEPEPAPPPPALLAGPPETAAEPVAAELA